MKLLFLRRAGCEHSDRAEVFLRALFSDVTSVQSAGIGDKIPAEIEARRFDAVMAFRSHIIVRRPLLDTKVCLNFHPGPPERPGTGCVNFALYEGDETYGSTCHYMAEDIDAGPIVDVHRFPILPSDDVASVLRRSYDFMVCQLYNIASVVAQGALPMPSGQEWTRKATVKRQMDALREIPPGASPEEIARIDRATSFGQFRPFMRHNGYRFTLDRVDEKIGRGDVVNADQPTRLRKA